MIYGRCWLPIRAELQDGLEEVRDSLAQRRFQLQMDQAEWLEQRERELRALRARLDEVRQSRIFGQRRLLRAFPGMRSTAHQPALERLRRRLERAETESCVFDYGVIA